jgi:hypothetical protein
MLRVNWLLGLQKTGPLKTPMLVVAVSALVALLFTLATRPAAEPARAAGEARIELLRDEHASVTALVRAIQANTEAERLAAERSRAEMRELALVEASEQKVPAPIFSAKAAPVRVAMPVTKPVPATEPPLPLRAAAASEPRPPKPVAARARAVLATVQQIPGWIRTGVENVADWAVSTSSKAISQLPEQRFL